MPRWNKMRINFLVPFDLVALFQKPAVFCSADAILIWAVAKRF